MKIVKCVCFKCSKLRISKEKYAHLMKLSSEHRWNKVFQLASKVTRCGDDTKDGCGCLQPKKIKKEGLANIYAEWDNNDNMKNEDGVGDEKPTKANTRNINQDF